MSLFVKALIGAAIVVLIQILTRSKNFYIAGLVPLFPTFALISHYLVGTQRTLADLKLTIIFSMLSLIPYFVYLLSLYFFVDRIPLVRALFAAAFCWIVSASLLLILWKQFSLTRS